jgi:hypothetical protein
MPRKNVTVFALVVIGCLVGALVLFRDRRTQLPTKVSFTISVSPPGQLDYVIGQGSSAKLKYDAAKRAGMKPALAQRLVLKPVPNTSNFEAQGGAESKDEGEKFVAAYFATLQERCVARAEVALVTQSVR